MRVLQTAVSTDGFREFTTNRARTKLLRELAEMARKARCDLLLVPAGFWLAHGRGEADSFIHEAARIARRYRVAVVGGIDLPSAKETNKSGGKKGKAALAAVKEKRLPYLGFAVERSGRCHGLGMAWRQLSTSTDNAPHAPPLDPVSRAVQVGRSTIAVLICGEMHNRKVRESMGGHGFRAVVVSGHRSYRRVVKSIGAIRSAARAPVLHSQHLVGENGHMHLVDARGTSSPAPVAKHLVPNGATWAAAVVREINA